MSELTLAQWKAKFENANMDKSEAIFRERKAQADFAKLLDASKKLAEALGRLDCSYYSACLNGKVLEQVHSDACVKCEALSYFKSFLKEQGVE